MNEDEPSHERQKRTRVLTPEGAARVGHPELANRVVTFTEEKREGKPVTIAKDIKTLSGKKIGFLSVSPDGIVPADSPPETEN